MRKINIYHGTRYLFPTHVNDMLLPREQAESIEAFLVVIQPGMSTHRHAHADTEQLYYVVSGEGRAALANPDGSLEESPLLPNDLLHIPRNTIHQIFCTGTQPLRYLCVDAFPSGKPHGEPTWDHHYRAVIRQQGDLK